MGGTLVERHARDVVLTPLGRQALAHSNAVLGAADRLSRVADDQGSGHRSLSLGLIPTLAPYLLPGVLAQLRASDLLLEVQIREAKTENLLDSLRSGDLDAAVLALPSGADGLEEVVLFEDRFLLAGSQARFERLGDAVATLRPTDLEASQLMLLEDGHCLTDQALDVCHHDRGSGGINMGASSLGTLSRLVAAGFGLTLMPELAARAEQNAAPGLCLHRFPGTEPSRQIGLVRRASTPEQGWFSDLEGLIRSVGLDIVQASRTEPGLIFP